MTVFRSPFLLILIKKKFLKIFHKLQYKIAVRKLRAHQTREQPFFVEYFLLKIKKHINSYYYDINGIFFSYLRKYDSFKTEYHNKNICSNF